MADEYVEKLADLIIDHSFGGTDFEELWQNRQKRLLMVYERPADALAQAIAERVYDAGGNLFVEQRPSWGERTFLTHSRDDVLTGVDEFIRDKQQYVGARLFIKSPENTKALASVDGKRRMQRAEAMQELSKPNAEIDVAETLKRGEPVYKIPWCLTAFPTEALAQDFGTDLDTYSAFLWDLMLLNEDDPTAAWKAMGAEQKDLIENVLSKATTFTLKTSDGTDLTMKLKDATRTHLWIPSYGKRNLPSGEVFNAPIKDTVEGIVKFPILPQYHSGGPEVSDIVIEFSQGKVVNYSAGTGEDYLDSFFGDADSPNRYLGEIAVGLNPKVTEITKQILFDEKMGGAVHMAFGKAYNTHVPDPKDDSSGLNVAPAHWDMIKRMWPSEDGKIVLDDRWELTWSAKDERWEVDDTQSP